MYLTAVGGVVYFVANDGKHGLELWESNGTQLGTSLVADVNPGSPAPIPLLDQCQRHSFLRRQ